MKNSNLSAYNYIESFFGCANSRTMGWQPAQEFAAHSVIISQDTPAAAVYFIESGLVKLSRIEPTGREVIAGLRRRHWLMGSPAVFLRKQYSFNVTTLVACRMRRISAQKFLDLVETDAAFSRALLRMLSQEVYTQGRQFVNLGCQCAKERLKRLLYEVITEMVITPDAQQEIKLQVPLKHREMAQMIAVTPEHLSRLLKSLEQEGAIKRDGNVLMVRNATALMAQYES